MDNSKRTMITFLASFILLMVAIIGATYAFFSATASVTEQSLSVHTASPTELIYDGIGLLSLENAIPGDRTEVKTFTIENPSTSTVSQIYSLSLHADSNNYSATNYPNQLMMYIGYGNCDVDESSDEPLTCDKIIELDLTDSDAEMSAGTEKILYQALIEPDEIQKYYAYIKFDDIGENQDENKNKSFSGHIELKDTELIKNENLPYKGLSLTNKVKIPEDHTRTLKVAHTLNNLQSVAYQFQTNPGVSPTSFQNIVINMDSAAIADKIDEFVSNINLNSDEQIYLAFSFRITNSINPNYTYNYAGFTISSNGEVAFSLTDYTSEYGKIIHFNYKSYSYSNLPSDSWILKDNSDYSQQVATIEQMNTIIARGGFNNMSSVVLTFPDRYKTDENIMKALEIFEVALGITFETTN